MHQQLAVNGLAFTNNTAMQSTAVKICARYCNCQQNLGDLVQIRIHSYRFIDGGEHNYYLHLTFAEWFLFKNVWKDFKI